MMPAPPSSTPPARRRAILFVVAGLLLTHFALAVGGKLGWSTTTDELVHLTAGVSYWRNHDYRLQPENGILPQRWAALPAWLGGATFPKLEGNDAWRLSDAWEMGHQFFYETGEDHFPRLMAGRAMIALFSVATGLLVFCWSRRFFGTAGGLVSLAFFTFCPTFLAHGALVTSDVVMTFFFLAACGTWWRHLHDGRRQTWWLSALVLGLAFVAKYSAVLLIPMLLAMGAVRVLNPLPLVLAGRVFHTRGGKVGAILGSLLGHAGVVALVIWAFFGFRYSAFNPSLPPADQFIRAWSDYEGTLSPLVAKTILFMRTAHLLPEAYLYGFVYVIETVKMRGAFLNGDYSNTGWFSFFPWAFWLKTPVPLLLASALAIGIAVRRRLTASVGEWQAGLYHALPLIVLFVVYAGSALTSHLNIGQRHILPLYPVIFIGVGVLGAWLTRRRPVMAAGLAILLGWHVVCALRIAPHQLAYFNEFAGGPERGRYHLVDSSLDWGQDLPALKKWLATHAGMEPVYLSYFGSGEPDYYHLHVRRLAFLNLFVSPPVCEDLQPGFYCVSATILTQVYGSASGPWTLEYEAAYQNLRPLAPLFSEYAHNPARRREFDQAASPWHWRKALQRYDTLRLARLCCYLRQRAPDGQAGYSIWIYHLNAREIAAATAGPFSQLSALIDATAQR